MKQLFKIRHIGKPLAAWIVVAVAVCLMPGPGYWEGRLPESGGPGMALGRAGSPSAPLDGEAEQNVLPRPQPATQHLEPKPDSPFWRSLLRDHRKTKERLGLRLSL